MSARSSHVLCPSSPSADPDRDVKRVLNGLAERGLLDEMRAVCKRNAVTIDEAASRRRTKNVARARHEFWWHLRSRSGSTFSYPEIAGLFGVDHTTVMAGVRSFALTQKSVVDAPRNAGAAASSSTLDGSLPVDSADPAPASSITTPAPKTIAA